MQSFSRRSPRVFGMMIAIVMAGSPAMAGELVSFKDDATVPHELPLNGLLVGAGAVIHPGLGIEILSEESIFGLVAEDIDALHLMSNGHYLLSTAASSTVGGTFFLGGDIIEFDPETGTATEFMDVSVFGSTAINVDAVYLIESGPDSGSVVLSTTGNATLGGVVFRHGDLVQYDKLADTAALVFDQDAITGAGSQKNIDALHITPIGDLIISVNISNGSLGGVTLESSDLVLHTPGGATSVLLDGFELFDGQTASLDAVGGFPAPVPLLSPLAMTVLFSGLAMTGVLMAVPRRRG